LTAWCVSLRAGDKIEIRGFGSFRTRQRKPRTGRNPKTGEKVEVPAKKIPFLQAQQGVKGLGKRGDRRAGGVASAASRGAANGLESQKVRSQKSEFRMQK